MNWNAAHLHLLLNHIPVLGIPCGVGLLIASLWRMNHTLQRAGFALFILTGVSAIATDLTGDPAKDILNAQMAADFPKAAVHEHEQAADFGLVGSCVLGVAALGALWGARRAPLKRVPIIGLVAGGLFMTAVLARVADLGGEIRHVEIRSGATGDPAPN